jgi:TolB-like protein/Tfp pilus assembly protein PilF
MGERPGLVVSAERLGFASEGRFRLGDRLITPGANEIDGARIDPKVMDVLVALVEGAPEVMSGAALLDCVWADVVVVPNVVYQAIAQLRKALGDDPNAPRYIETIPRRGYRVIAQIKRVESGTPEYDATNVDGAHSAKPSTPLVRKNSICVLPFVNMSGDPEQEYFSDGITEDIITDLSKVSALFVIARNTAFTFKAKSVDVTHVARKLGVSHVLAGSVRKAAGTVRITAQLIDGVSGGQVWAERFDRGDKNIFSLQDEIASAIVNALKVSLLPEEKERIQRQLTTNLDADELYRRSGTDQCQDEHAAELYLRGRHCFNKRDRSNLERAIAFFRDALMIHGSYPKALIGMADCYIALANRGYWRPADAFKRAELATRQALDMSKDLPEVHATLANLKASQKWDWRGAEREYVQAIALGPGYVLARQWFGLFLSAMGRTEEARIQMRSARVLDPLSPIVQVSDATVSYHARECELAARQCMAALDLEPDYANAHLALGSVYSMLNEHDRAIEHHSRCLMLSGNEDPQSLAWLGSAYARAGRATEAYGVLDRLAQLGKTRYVSPFFFALTQANLGDSEGAFQSLEQAKLDRCDWFQDLRVEPLLDGLRGDSRFDALLHSVGLEVGSGV